MKHIALVLFACALALNSGGSAQAAPASQVGPNLVIHSHSSDYCMDASLDRNEEGREVYIFKCTGHYNQRWTFTQGADGSSAIVGFDGRCVDIRGRHVRDNSAVELYGCNSGANQQFELTAQGQIRERQSGKCLTFGGQPADRRPVFIDDCDGNPTQLWNVQRPEDRRDAQ